MYMCIYIYMYMYIYICIYIYIYTHIINMYMRPILQEHDDSVDGLWLSATFLEATDSAEVHHGT